jgi:GTPase SAR1 family protein
VSLINYSTQEISCKVVKLISLATEMDRTLFFDFLPLDLGTIKGFQIRFHLYTVPGQVYYDASRKLILRGVDGIIFVADSLASRFDANVESMYNMHENLAEHGEELNPSRYPYFEAVATQGVGVFDTLKNVSKQVLRKLA